MINYIILAITVALTIFNIWLTFKNREFRSGYSTGYDKGLEDGIRMANEVIQEDDRSVQGSGDCDHCSKLFIDCPGR